MVERVRVYAVDQGSISLSRPCRGWGGGIGEAVWSIYPGDLDGMVWAELRQLPCGAELDLEFDRRHDGAVPRHARVVRAILPSREPARVDAPATATAAPSAPPEPTERERLAEGIRAATASMRAFLKDRGLVA